MNQPHLTSLSECMLLIPRNDVETALNNRLNLGYALLKALKSVPKIDELKTEFFQWNEMNRSVLKAIYSCEEYLENYNAWYGRISRLRIWSEAEEIEVSIQELEYKIDVLEDCLEELEQLPEMDNMTPYEFEDFED